MGRWHRQAGGYVRLESDPRSSCIRCRGGGRWLACVVARRAGGCSMGLFVFARAILSVGIDIWRE